MTSFEGQLELLCSSLTLQDSSAAIRTLIKIVQNALDHPGEEHYRHLNTTNNTFNTKVWRHTNARDFMLAIGWVQVEGAVVLPSDNLLQDALIALTKTKSVLDMQGGSPPSVSREQPLPPSSPTRSRASPEKDSYKERMKMMKEQQRKTELEKQRIAEQIKADRREASQRKAQTSHANHLNFGGHMTSFNDIGVDLNKGGG